MIDVLEKALKVRKDVTLIYVGDGPLEEAVKMKAQAYGVDDHVRFLGMRGDVPDILQAADVFVLPSIWEGLPLTAIEAQASGLHCVVSDTLSQELNALGMVKYVSGDNLDAWVEALFEAGAQERKDTYNEIIASGYDINTTVPWLQKFYLSHNK